MRLRLLRLLLCTLTLAMLALPGAVLPAEPKPKPAGESAADKQGEINKLRTQFRLAAKDPDKRAKIITAATALGTPAVSALLAAIQRELAPQLKHYGGKFHQGAAAVVRKHGSPANSREVAELRDTVLGLQKAPDFSHEMLVAKGNPALKRLEELFTMTPDEVLRDSAALQADRKKLFELGRLWEQCAAYLHDHPPKGTDPPKESPTFEKFLRGEEESAMQLATPMDPAARNILAANGKLAGKIDAQEARAMQELNFTRGLLGLPVLAIDLKLCEAARDHCQDMVKLNFFAHESPVEGKTTPWERAKRMGATASAENIASGARDGKAANMMWFDSPGHHKNMLGPYARVGVGRSGEKYTEMFGK